MPYGLKKATGKERRSEKQNDKEEGVRESGSTEAMVGLFHMEKSPKAKGFIPSFWVLENPYRCRSRPEPCGFLVAQQHQQPTQLQYHVSRSLTVSMDSSSRHDVVLLF
jgi:hypothetical protein